MATVLSQSTGFRTATTRDEVLHSLAELGDEATILAGGTDVMVQFLHGEISPSWLLHIERVTEFDSFDVSEGGISLGPLVTHRRVNELAELARALPGLAEASATVGGWQTQAVGTVVGNVCNASPAADTLPPLLTAGAIVNLASRRGERSLPLTEFVTGRRTTAAEPDELVVGLHLEPCGPSTGETYLKVAPRTAMEVAVIGLAVRLTFESDRLTSARVAAGAVAPVPFRSAEAERVLVDSELSDQGVEEAGRILSEQSSPIDDARASASYRRRVTARLLRRAVAVARGRANEE